jgi:tetratricopeptide (TPR) repeat protein
VLTHSTTRAILGTLFLSAASFAQTAPPQNPPAAPCPASNPAPNQKQDQTAKPCAPQTPAPAKSAAEEHPFPGDVKPASPPDTPVPSTTPSGAAAQHPFPTTPAPNPADPDTSSSSSSSADDPDTAPQPPTSEDTIHPSRRRLPKVQRVQTDDERVDEDIKVAKFYMNDENYQGAYLRAKDAVSVQPDYSLTHFTLAEVLQKMKKKDEAVAEYQLYLKLDPEGEKVKDAKKALAELH